MYNIHRLLILNKNTQLTKNVLFQLHHNSQLYACVLVKAWFTIGAP